MQVCSCEQCSSGEYNPEDYQIDEEEFKRLDEEHPIGISGHLRVKDASLTLRECIESCIDALDELIVTYNTSKDDTEKILKEYALKYPEKIRLYHYKPNIICEVIVVQGKSEEESKEILEKVSKDIHRLPNYYNYGYVKIKYRYYMKIDADQIYFSEKLKCVRRAFYVSDFCSKNKIINNIISKILKVYRKLLGISNLTYLILENMLCYQDKCSFVLGGLNLSFNIESIGIPISAGNIKTNDLPYLLNGFFGDHAIWNPTSEKKYIQAANQSYETIVIPERIVQLGFFWCHLKKIVKNKEIDKNYKIISLLEFARLSYSQLLKSDLFNLFDNTSKSYVEIWKQIFQKFWDTDRKYITKKYCDQYIDQIYNDYRNMNK